jgi:hypothetical protein
MAEGVSSWAVGAEAPVEIEAFGAGGGRCSITPEGACIGVNFSCGGEHSPFNGGDSVPSIFQVGGEFRNESAVVGKVWVLSPEP